MTWWMTLLLIFSVLIALFASGLPILARFGLIFPVPDFVFRPRLVSGPGHSGNLT